eukprot:tig00021135_g18939.t1
MGCEECGARGACGDRESCVRTPCLQLEPLDLTLEPGPDADRKAAREPERKLRLLDFKSPGTRVFYLEALAFYAAYFAWFSTPPLISAIKEDLHLSERQIQLSHAVCIGGAAFARLAIGQTCDRYGPRLSHGVLLVASVLCFVLLGCSASPAAFILARLLLSALGASPVAIRVHGTVMFDAAIQGTVCCSMIGFGDAGAGVAQLAMPLVRRAFLSLGSPEGLAWRLAMLLPALQLLAAGGAVLLLTEDCPEGRPRPPLRPQRSLWLLFLAYAANSGTEFMILNTATRFFERRFNMSIELAGLIAFAFSPNDLYASVLAGAASDRLAARRGPAGRKWFAVGTLGAQGASVLLLGLAGLAGPLPAVVALFFASAVATYLGVAAISCLIPLITDELLQLGAANAVVATSGVLFGFLLSFLFGGPLSDAQVPPPPAPPSLPPPSSSAPLLPAGVREAALATLHELRPAAPPDPEAALEAPRRPPPARPQARPRAAPALPRPPPEP